MTRPTSDAGERFLDLALAALAVHPDPQLHHRLHQAAPPQRRRRRLPLLLPGAAIDRSQKAKQLPHGASHGGMQQGGSTGEGRSLARLLWALEGHCCLALCMYETGARQELIDFGGLLKQ